MALDSKKAAAFDCSKCDKGSQRLRNCTGKYADAVNLLNAKIYSQCPKAIWLTSPRERLLLALYIDCRESKVLPDSGSILDQTAFTYELFKYLDSLMAEYRQKKQDEHDAEVARLQKEAGKNRGK